MDVNKINPYKTLSYLSDCTRDKCILSRLAYRTRDVAIERFLKNINFDKTYPLTIANYGSFKLLTELFYLTDLIKNGYTVKNVHLIDIANWIEKNILIKNFWIPTQLDGFFFNLWNILCQRYILKYIFTFVQYNVRYVECQ